MIRLAFPDPRLDFDRGRLRPWQVDDAVVLMQAWTDPDIMRWNPVPEDRSLAAAQRWIEHSQSRLEAGRSLDLCIEDEPSARVVGEVGLSGFDAGRGAALVGWWLLPEGRGRGLATNAVAALTEWALGPLGLATIVARCATANALSQAVAARCGYSHERTAPDDHQLWVRRR